MARSGPRGHGNIWAIDNYVWNQSLIISMFSMCMVHIPPRAIHIPRVWATAFSYIGIPGLCYHQGPDLRSWSEMSALDRDHGAIKVQAISKEHISVHGPAAVRDWVDVYSSCYHQGLSGHLKPCWYLRALLPPGSYWYGWPVMPLKLWCCLGSVWCFGHVWVCVPTATVVYDDDV